MLFTISAIVWRSDTSSIDDGIKFPPSSSHRTMSTMALRTPTLLCKRLLPLLPLPFTSMELTRTLRSPRKPLIFAFSPVVSSGFFLDFSPPSSNSRTSFCVWQKTSWRSELSRSISTTLISHSKNSSSVSLLS